MLASPYKGSYFGVLRLANEAVLIFGLRGHIYRSDDFGLTWLKIPINSQAALMDGDVLRNGTVILVGQDGTVLVSSDNANSFHLRSQPSKHTLASVIEINSTELAVFGEAGVAHLVGSQ